MSDREFHQVNGIVAFVRFVDRINYYVGKYFVSWIILVLMFLSLYAVFMRRVMNNPAAWTFEILSYIFCAHLMLALGYTLYYREHVNVDVVVNHFSERTQAVIEVLTYVVLLGAFLYFLLPAAYKFAERSWLQGERAPTGANLPVYPGKVLVPIGLVLLGVQTVAHILKNVVFIVTGRKV